MGDTIIECYQEDKENYPFLFCIDPKNFGPLQYCYLQASLFRYYTTLLLGLQSEEYAFGCVKKTD